MGRPPTHGAPSFRFFAAEVAQMETLLREHNGHVPPRELLMSLANKFSNSVERSGKSAVQMKQVWNWFQNRRYALRSKLVKPTTNSTIPPNPRDDAAQVRNVPPVPQQAHQPSGHNVVRNTSENPPMEFEAKSARDGAWYDVQAFLSHRYLETGNPEVLVRFSGFGPEEDEWLNVRRLVRQRSLPCESTECVAVLPTDLILCFQEGKEQALYFDAHVLDAQRRRHDVRGCRCRFLVRYDHDQTEEIVPLRKICRRPETDYRLQQLHAANESASASTSTSTSVSAESRRPVADPNLINSARVANSNPNPSAAVTVPPTITNVSAQSLISPPSSSSTLASASTISSTLAAPNPSLAPISAPTPSPTSISAPTPSPSLISAASPSSTHSAPTPSQTLKSAPSPSLTTISAPTPSSTSIFAPSPSSTPNFAPTPSSTPNFAPTPTLIPTPSSSSTPLSGPTPSPALISAPSSSTQFSEALISAPSSSTQFSDASPSLTPAPAPSLTLISSSSTSPTLTSAPSQTPMSAPSPKLISAQTSTLISTTTPIPAPASAPNVSPILAPAPSLAPVPTSLTPDAAPDSKKFEGGNSGASVEDISTGVASIVVEAKKNEIGVTPETSMVTESSISQEELSGNPTVPVAEPKKVGNLAPSESTMVVSCFSADGEPTVSTVVESSNLTVSDDKE